MIDIIGRDATQSITNFILLKLWSLTEVEKRNVEDISALA